MKILFIFSLTDVQSLLKPLQSLDQIQLGVSYISSYLKQHGHKTELLVLSKMFEKSNSVLIDDHIKKFSPKVICFTAVATEYPFISKVAKYIKQKYPDRYLVVGGVHASLNPDEVLEDVFDAVCVGEGEQPVLELVTALENGKRPTKIPNLWIKKDLFIEKNQTRAFIENLDVLPFPDRDMWLKWIEEQSGSTFSVLLGRGCPYQCSYCCNHAIRKLAPGKYVRFRSPKNIVSEIRGIVQEYPKTKTIALEIETIGANRQWATALCAKLEEFNSLRCEPISFEVNLRVTKSADLEWLFIALKKSNFKSVTVGIESGSERVRRDILKRDYSNRDIINCVKLARKYGIAIIFQNMIGLPGETLEDFIQTIELNRECLPNWIYLSIFFPYPGTDIHSLCKSKGYVTGKIDTEMERFKATINYPDFSKKDIQRNFIWFYFNIYRGHKPFIRLLLQVLVLTLKSNLFMNYIYRGITRLELVKGIKNRYKLSLGQKIYFNETKKKEELSDYKENNLKDPLVSIIMPTYNYSQFIAKSIKSVLDQSYSNFELIVVDDYSEDNTEEVVKGFKDSRIKYYKVANNRVIAASRNFAIMHAVGEFIAFLDSDDLWYENKLEEIILEFNQNPDVDFICHALNLVYKDQSDRKVRVENRPWVDYEDLLFRGNCITTSATVIRSNKLSK
ncbi:MAG: glycosyltransferase, partial [Candidatus Omnitrophica bacterium]|nr:glycosyltransferase [Candidatus Omnitrophota bacterium]